MLGGITDIPLLGKESLIDPSNTNGGIVIVGSHVNKTTKQLESLMESKVPIQFVEFNVETVLTKTELAKEKSKILSIAENSLRSGKTTAIYTSRKLLQENNLDKEKQLALSVRISDALTEIAGTLSIQPSFIIAKGGITSSDIGTKALKVHRATVMGQIKPGISVWMTGAESTYPNMPYIIFPGNVGEVSTLREIVEELSN